MSDLCNRETIKIYLFLFSLLLYVYVTHTVHKNIHFDVLVGQEVS